VSTHTASYPIGIGVKRPGREADHPPVLAQVKTAYAYTSTPPYVFMDWYIIKHRYNFALTENRNCAKRLSRYLHAQLTLGVVRTACNLVTILTELHALSSLLCIYCVGRP